jgi:hypothetical protein
VGPPSCQYEVISGNTNPNRFSVGSCHILIWTTTHLVTKCIGCFRNRAEDDCVGIATVKVLRRRERGVVLFTKNRAEQSRLEELFDLRKVDTYKEEEDVKKRLHLV